VGASSLLNRAGDIPRGERGGRERGKALFQLHKSPMKFQINVFATREGKKKILIQLLVCRLRFFRGFFREREKGKGEKAACA